MKTLIVAAGVCLLVLVAIRRFGPVLAARAMTRCQEMFDRMPEEFPPKRIVHGIEEIREQNSQILRELEGERAALVGRPGGR